MFFSMLIENNYIKNIESYTDANLKVLIVSNCFNKLVT